MISDSPFKIGDMVNYSKPFWKEFPYDGGSNVDTLDYLKGRIAEVRWGRPQEGEGSGFFDKEDWQYLIIEHKGGLVWLPHDQIWIDKDGN